jgi:hypothetical protein
MLPMSVATDPIEENVETETSTEVNFEHENQAERK